MRLSICFPLTWNDGIRRQLISKVFLLCTPAFAEASDSAHSSSTKNCPKTGGTHCSGHFRNITPITSMYSRFLSTMHWLRTLVPGTWLQTMRQTLDQPQDFPLSFAPLICLEIVQLWSTCPWWQGNHLRGFLGCCSTRWADLSGACWDTHRFTLKRWN